MEGEDGQCTVCLDVLATAVLVSCGHAILCGACMKEVFGEWGKQMVCREEGAQAHLVLVLEMAVG